MTSDNHPQAEFLRNQFFSTISHCSRRLPVMKQVDDPRRQTVGSVRWYQESAPAVADHLATTWHARGYDRDAGKSRLEQHARHALAILRRERKAVGEPEQRRDVGSRSNGDDIGGMLVDFGLR